MKKILFATTALVAFAGAASADIALTGWAEMGIVGGEVYDDTTQFWTDIDVTFTMTGEADNGLTFGAKVDLDENGAFAGTTQGGETIWISYGNATLTMGDVDGAFDAAMKEVTLGGSIDDAEESAGFNGNSGLDGTYDGQIAQFKYTFDAFTVYASVELYDFDVDDFDPVWGLGVTYSTDISNAKVGFGLGYQSVSYGSIDESIWGLSVDAAFDNGFSAVLNYSDYESDTFLDWTHWGIGLGYTMNALTLAFNYGIYDIEGDYEDSGWGLTVGYDLGGGLEVKFGYGDSDLSFDGDTYADYNQYSLGLSMSF